jgi:4-amino-4-deoxy-L-arabinose transferase-like glycosyltransferase
MNYSDVIKKLRAHWPLVPILSYGAAAGFWFLPARGSVFIDEGYQLLEAQWVAHKIGYLLTHLTGFHASTFLLSDGPGRPPVYAKPMHAVLDALALRIFPGAPPTRILILQGLFGLGAILAVYVIGLRLGGKTAAAASSAVLAVSVTFLAYRRSGMPEADSVFFFTMAVLVLVVASDRGLLRWRASLLAGLFTGLCFACNDRWYVAMPLVIVLALVLSSRHAGWARPRHVFPTVVLILAGIAVVVLGFEAISVLTYRVARHRHLTLPYETYFNQLQRRWRANVTNRHGAPRLSQIVHAPYAGYLRSFEGRLWVWIIAALGVFSLARFRRRHAVALLWFGVPFALVSASSLTAPRFVSLALPGLALVAGLSIAAIASVPRRVSKMIAGAALAGIVASSIAGTPQIFRVRGNWDHALATIKAQGGGVIASPKSFSLSSSVGVDNVVLGFKDSLAWARQAVETENARWLVLEVWAPPGTALRAIPDSPDSITVIGRVGELSSFFLREQTPLVADVFPPHDFVYEGFPRDRQRVIAVYDMSVLLQ